MSIKEARDIAEGDMRRRMKDLERGGRPAGPEEYVDWAREVDGDYRVAKKISL